MLFVLKRKFNKGILMKLIKKKLIKVSTLSSILLASGLCFSSQVEMENISKRCEQISDALYQIHETSEYNSCAWKVRYVGGVMEGAANLIRLERYSSALYNLKVADSHLNYVHSHQEECSFFSWRVTPFLGEIKSLLSDLAGALEQIS